MHAIYDVIIKKKFTGEIIKFNWNFALSNELMREKFGDFSSETPRYEINCYIVRRMNGFL